MAPLASMLVVVPLLAGYVAAQTPLAEKRFNYTNLPYQVDTDSGERGRQSGYNRCNATTAGQDSLCQTAVINSIDDWCVWSAQEPNGIVGDIEGEMVAWCTKGDLHGARQIPAGAITGVQFVRTPNYVQVTGFINQPEINIQADDQGGEMDPHGADRRGNPLGGLLFSQAFRSPATRTVINSTSSDASTYQQVIEWHNFMGAGVFCLKACDPAWAGGPRMCEHIYDRVGCNVNAPAAYRNNTFETCLSDNQLPPGIYVGANNVTSTWSQPGEGTVIATLPYKPFTPASSSCTTYESTNLFLAASTTASTASSTSAATTTTGAGTSRQTGTGTGTGTGTSAGAAPTTTTSAGARGMVASTLAALLAVGSALVLA